MSATPRSVSLSTPSKEYLDLSDTTPAPGSSRSSRRKSTLWMRSPSSSEGTLDDKDAAEDDSDRLILSPVPATPAPETISAYAEQIFNEPVSETGQTPGGAATPYYLKKEQLLQMTCPPKRTGGEVVMEEGATGGTGNGVLMQRLLLARRKSLQWAPKVGSPLAKGSVRREW